VAGLTGTVTMVVTSDDTAIAMGSGAVPVLATPRLVALCEQATCAALDGHLPPDSTTVGIRVELDHLQPTVVGRTVTAEAVLETIEGRRFTFVVSASDERGPIASGRVTRALVDLALFLEKAR
jgi:fluoroacetyl-CoA thioesterase